MSLEVNIEKNLGTFNLKVNFNSNDKTLGFLGESGSGKSMSLKCIAGLETPDKGRIVINNKVLFDSEKKINVSTKDRKIGYLFQNYALFPNMTIEDNITIGLQNLKKSEKKRLCNEYIEKFHLHGLNKRYPWQLSGGQQQRVALARALITNPEILLLDEPFSALDHHLRHSMERELINSLKDYKGNVIFVTHDIEESYRVCENIIVYDRGSALSKKSRDQLFISPSSLAEAKLTGCNNISRVKRINENTIYAIDFGYEYSFDYTLNENIEYMGIRSHHIKISSSPKENTNCHLFKIVNIIENPFDFSINLVSDEDNSLSPINVKIEKNNFNYKINDKIYLTFYSNNIFLF